MIIKIMDGSVPSNHISTWLWTDPSLLAVNLQRELIKAGIAACRRPFLDRSFSKSVNYALEGDETQGIWNNDVTQVRGIEKMARRVKQVFAQGDVAVYTPAFNSPHPEFHPYGMGWNYVSWVDWTMPIINMEAWNALGGFDEDVPDYGADALWCKRARDAGWSFVKDNEVVFNHYGSATAKAVGHQWDTNFDSLRAKGIMDWRQLI